MTPSNSGSTGGPPPLPPSPAASQANPERDITDADTEAQAIETLTNSAQARTPAATDARKLARGFAGLTSVYTLMFNLLTLAVFAVFIAFFRDPMVRGFERGEIEPPTIAAWLFQWPKAAILTGLGVYAIVLIAKEVFIKSRFLTAAMNFAGVVITAALVLLVVLAVFGGMAATMQNLAQP